MRIIKKQAILAVQLMCFAIVCSLVLGCGGTYPYFNKAENPYNYPQYDYFVENGLNHLSDFDLKGNVKNMIQYKPSKNPTAAKKSLDFDVSFTPEGYLQTHSKYHTGAFFFHGKKDVKITVDYKNNKKRLIEKHIMGDSISVRLINTYDRNGNLLTTENELNLRKYFYDSQQRVIKEEQYQKHKTGVSNTPKNTQLFEFKSDTYKVQTRLLEEEPRENILFSNAYHEFYYYDDAGNLEKRISATANDTVIYQYNKNKQLIAENNTRAGKPFRSATYKYDDGKNRLAEEKHFRQGRPYQSHIYEYDDNNNVIKRTTYRNTTKLSEMTNKYTYDTNNNWITKTTVVNDLLSDEVYEFGTISREIEYYE